jgi:NAD(P)H-quinone oxidoreductase subunit 5
MHALLALAPPLLFALAAWDAGRRPGLRPDHLIRGDWAGLGAIAASVLAVAALLLWGPADLVAAGFGPRLDAVSAVMLVVTSLLGWVVLRYARTYMDGAPRQGAFAARMGGTLAAVTLLVGSGGLWQMAVAFGLTAWMLNGLLTVASDRPAAHRAARKARLAQGLAGGLLLVACALMAMGYGTADIGEILILARGGLGNGYATWAAIALAVAALAASAQMPLHGWVTEAMEAPTPVSALLHAGIVNAGGFFLIRLADVMLMAPGALAAVALFGGAVALIAGLIAITQTAVKTSIAWSTVAQMGFMLLQCGLGLFALALLHVAAHSLYKAHAFLASGQAVERIGAERRPGAVAVPGAGAVLAAFGIALGLYALAAWGFAAAFGPKPIQAVALGAILIFGTAYLVAQGLAEKAPGALTLRTSLAAAAAAVAYLMLQTAAEWWTLGTLPPVPLLGPLEWKVLVLAVIGFGVVAVAQAMLPLWAQHPAVRGLRVHLSNGLYLDSMLDRAFGLRAAPKTQA